MVFFTRTLTIQMLELTENSTYLWDKPQQWCGANFYSAADDRSVRTHSLGPPSRIRPRYIGTFLSA